MESRPNRVFQITFKNKKKLHDVKMNLEKAVSIPTAENKEIVYKGCEVIDTKTVDNKTMLTIVTQLEERVLRNSSKCFLRCSN